MNAIMLHYFHGGEHRKSQGSISADDLIKYIETRGPEHFLGADEWTSKLEKNTLDADDFCLTFDDNLKCQADVALPVLDHYKKTGFWFVYTSPYAGITDRLELYRYFRNEFYDSMDDFYADFFIHANVENELKNFPEDYLKQFSFYSRNDRVFRYLRDKVLGPEKYFAVMDSMIKAKNVDTKNVNERLWFREDSIKKLSDQGHCIGLHSHTHPTNMAGLPKEDQLKEYKKNKEFLENITGRKIEWVAHPCGSYNSITLDLLSSMGIKYGFRADSQLKKYSSLELPRIDSAELIKN